MQRILDLEPSLIINTASSVVGLLIAAGLLSQANGDALMTALAAVVPAVMTIISAVLVRRRVYSPATVNRMVGEDFA
jgi:hypothetical protein